MLRVHRPGDPWSVWRWRDHGRWRSGCYVNLETPWRRSALGFDTRDRILDLVIGADGAPQWKDEDELLWALEVGTVSAAEGVAVRAAGEQALTHVGSGGLPFGANWDRWLPDPGWPVPPLDPDSLRCDRE